MKKHLLFSLLVSAFTLPVIAQDVPKEDTLQKTLEGFQSDLKNLKKLKVSGYLQAQAQFADSMGNASFAGGDFGKYVDKRIMVRRGRIKFAYDNSMSQYVLQFDVTEKGVGIKDAYAKFTCPGAKAIAFSIGAMNRPFGFEVPFSSSDRESPERGRMSQIIFPNERDLGAMITIQAPKTSRFNFFKIEAGMFNGTSISAVDFDYQKDFIGRMRIDKTTKNEKFKYGIGVSAYAGGWRQGTSTIYKTAMDTTGLGAFNVYKDTSNFGVIAKRQYGGVDFQLSYDAPWGLTTFRTEYIAGVQPSVSSSTKSPDVQPATDTYIRNFNGMYVYFIQNIGQSKHQLVVKYDSYDPNTDVKGDQIGATVITPKGYGSFAKTGKTDLAYYTLGIGWTYRWDANVKIIAYYDMGTNETSVYVPKMGADLHDNVFTLRVQYKF